jgi:hypothetical protein
MPPLTGLYHFAGDVLQICRAYGAGLRVTDPRSKSQWDSIHQLRVGAERLPWVIVQKIINPNGNLCKSSFVFERLK